MSNRRRPKQLARVGVQRILTLAEHAIPEARQRAQEQAQHAMVTFLAANPHLHLLDACRGTWEPHPWHPSDEPRTEPLWGYAYRLEGYANDDLAEKS